MISYNILICGSREATPGMLDTAYRLVRYAAMTKATVIVGDAKGVDLQVIKSCRQLLVPFICFGITPRPRMIVDALGIKNYIQVHPFWRGKPLTTFDKLYWVKGYPQRDIVMANYADFCMAVWDGKSRGTKFTYDHAAKVGKMAYIKDFSKMSECPKCGSTETFNRQDYVLCLTCSATWKREKYGPSITDVQLENARLKRQVSIAKECFDKILLGESPGSSAHLVVSSAMLRIMDEERSNYRANKG